MTQSTSNFDVYVDNLLHAYLIKMQEKTFYILVAIHHLAVGGASFRILSEDIITLYDQIKSQKNLKLSDKTMSYKDWSNTLLAKGKLLFNNEIDYWKSIIEKTITIFYIILHLYKAIIEGVEITLDIKVTKLLLEKVNNAYILK